MSKNLFLFHGEDNFSSTAKLKFWQEQFIKKYGDNINVEVIDGHSIDIGQFETNLETVPFLCEKRFIIVKDLMNTKKKNTDDTQKRIAKNISKIPEFCILVFHENSNADKRTSLYKKIQKIGKVEEFKALAPNQITNWIIQKSKTLNAIISPVNANFLGQQTGQNLWKVSSELTKLITFANGKEITKEIIETLVTPSLTTSIFLLTDFISQKNAKASIKTLETLKESGEELSKIFFMIIRHFRILIQVHDMIQRGEPQQSIKKRLGFHPYVIQKSSEQSRNFNSEKLENIYKQFLDVEISIKSGNIKTTKKDNTEYQLAIEKIILDCCK